MSPHPLRLYVAGPMTGLPDYNYPAFAAAAAHLRALGHGVISPGESFGGSQDRPLRDYARYDLHALLQVDGIVLLDGWECSVGASTEVANGLWLNLAFFRLVGGDLEPYEPANPVHLSTERHRVKA